VTRTRSIVMSSLVAMSAIVSCGRVPNADKRVEPAPGAVSGAGRVKGGRFTMDVQVGQAVHAAPAKAGSVTIVPAAAK
jgi:hypothetical protein